MPVSTSTAGLASPVRIDDFARLVVVEGQFGQLADGVGRIEMFDVEIPLYRTDHGVGPLQRRDVELLLVAEVVVDHPLGGAHLGGDLVHAGTGIALVGKLLGGHVQDLGPRPLGITLLRAA
jgi:hypothetical protein